jgi:hypothetical protein
MKHFYVFAAIIILALGVFLPIVQSAPQAMAPAPNVGKQVTITGEFSCTSCKLADPKNSCSGDCCRACINAGDPPLLTDEKGQMYILLSGIPEIGWAQEQLMNPETMMMLGGKVTVTGLLIKGTGIQAIYVKNIKKD